MEPFAQMGLTDAEAFAGAVEAAPAKAPQPPGLSGFGPGVVVETSEGPQPVEWLRAGDLLLTRDHGYQPLIWVGRSPLPKGQRPVRIYAGALGKRTPEHDLIVSPHHHLLLKSTQIDLHFASEEALVPAADIVTEAEADFTPPRQEYALCHLLMSDHEVLLAEGVWLESLWPEPAILSLLDATARAQIARKLGARIGAVPTARLMLQRGEAAVLHPRSAIAARRMVA